MGFFNSVVTVVSSAAHGDLGKAGHDLAAAASTVGMPLGEFYASFARHYGDAAMGTLDHLNKAIDDLQKVAHDPQVLYNQLADKVEDHYGKAAIELGVQDGSDANGDAAGSRPQNNPPARLRITTARQRSNSACRTVRIPTAMPPHRPQNNPPARPRITTARRRSNSACKTVRMPMAMQPHRPRNSPPAAPRITTARQRSNSACKTVRMPTAMPPHRPQEQSASKAADHYGKAAIELGVQDGTHANGDAAAPTAEQSASKAADHYGKAAIELGAQDGTHANGDAAAATAEQAASRPITTARQHRTRRARRHACQRRCRRSDRRTVRQQAASLRQGSDRTRHARRHACQWLCRRIDLRRQRRQPRRGSLRQGGDANLGVQAGGM